VFLACAREAADGLRERVLEAATERTTPEQRLWHALLAVFDFVEENAESWSILYPYGPVSAGPFAAAAAHARDAMAELLVELLASTAVGEGVDPEVAAETEPIAHALTGATIAFASWWRDHPEEPKEVQALRLMNFAWMGLGNLVEGRLWTPE
jgi:AcrR family transcriptional regulator